MVAPAATATEDKEADAETGVVPPNEEEDSASEDDSDSSSSDDALGDRLQKFGSGRLWWRTRRVRTCCAIAGILTVAAMTLLCWPRMPTWDLIKVEFSPDMVSQLASAFYDTKFNETIFFPLNASVNVWNPNFVAGASVGEGHFNVSYDNLQIGTAISLPMYSHHHAYCISHAVTENILSPQVNALLRHELTPDFRLKKRPVVEGRVPVKVWGLIPVTVHLKCSVDVHLLDLINAPPGKVVHDHDCTYRIR